MSFEFKLMRNVFLGSSFLALVWGEGVHGLYVYAAAFFFVTVPLMVLFDRKLSKK